MTRGGLIKELVRRGGVFGEEAHNEILSVRSGTTWKMYIVFIKQHSRRVALNNYPTSIKTPDRENTQDKYTNVHK